MQFRGCASVSVILRLRTQGYVCNNGNIPGENMETLLMVAVVLIALAVIAQAGVLIAMYLMSRRLSGKVELLLNDGKRLMPQFESITSNLKTVSEDLTETGKIARSQATHVQKIVADTHSSIRDQISEVSNALVNSIEEARTVAMRPI